MLLLDWDIILSEKGKVEKAERDKQRAEAKKAKRK